MGFKARAKEAPEISAGICAGCSKPLPAIVKDEESQIVDIRFGYVKQRPRYGRDDFVVQEKWGRMHRECFALAIGSPD